MLLTCHKLLRLDLTFSHSSEQLRNINNTNFFVLLEFVARLESHVQTDPSLDEGDEWCDCSNEGKKVYSGIQEDTKNSFGNNQALLQNYNFGIQVLDMATNVRSTIKNRS